MKPLPDDCARCLSAQDCPMAPTCRRTTEPHSNRFTASTYEGGEDCSGYWPETRQ